MVVARAVLTAFDTESRRLAEVVDGLDDGSFGRPSRCVPWTAGELLFHVQTRSTGSTWRSRLTGRRG